MSSRACSPPSPILPPASSWPEANRRWWPGSAPSSRWSTPGSPSSPGAGAGEVSRGEWDAAPEGLASRSQDLRNRLGVLALPAFNADDVADRWDGMGLAGRRAVLARVFKRIEVRRATTRGYEPERIKLTWRNPDVAAAVTAPPGAPDATAIEQHHHALG
jgi:hypothetical protein